jgi:uncharacterized membrane protein YphA (DoxX/SURF4 family)
MRFSVFAWVVVAILIVAAFWTANLTVYNWWAAGGPPTANPKQFEMRGNAFAVLTLLLFSGAIAIRLFNRKRSRHGADQHLR